MVMEMWSNFLFTFLGFLVLTVLVHAQDPSGFINVDCGLPANTSYTDATTGLNYMSDASLIETGISTRVATASSYDQQLWYVRSFPQGDRHCYNVTVTKRKKYLIRATFMYGNYDGQNVLPEFGLHLGPNKWVIVKISNASSIVRKEIIHIPTWNYVYICLVNTGNGTPFVSALEMRPLNNDSYQTQSGSLMSYLRLDIGSSTNKTVRYPDDVYDRRWIPFHYDGWAEICTSETIGTEYSFQPPSTVMSCAGTPANASEPMDFSIDPEDTTLEFYIYMYFAEIVKLEANQSRHFNISLNEEYWSDLTPDYLSSTTVYSTSASTGGNYSFSIFKSGRSTLPPLLNAIEFYSVVELPLSQTHQDDVNAIASIKSTYGIRSNWQGDPCAPRDYVWKGLTCSDNDPAAQPRIITLNLSSNGLMGEIAPDIANLKLLESLDLSNNNLTGSVPDFLSQLQSLKFLNLTGNNLTGAIPAALYQRNQTGSLSFSVDGNPELCPSVSCQKKKKKSSNTVVPVVVSVTVGALVLLATALAIILRCLKRKKKQSLVSSSGVAASAGKVELKTNRTYEPVEAKRRQFTYSEVLKITNNFGRAIGKGGFGTVYHGYLDGAQVAVKMLSPSSVQGYKEFAAEVNLLLRVHHRNLTSLVGYCDEGANMGLIYEYMANGNLKDNLSDKNRNILSWMGRLRIAAEAAQGLEYLHSGCKPQIVHRDVKSTNILLNEQFQAKLADFGLSRTFPVEEGKYVSTVVAGTPGYLDPEYYITNWLTEKSDVYSFGVVLLEIITRREVIPKTHDKTPIIQWVISMLEKGDIENIVDPRLRGDFNINSAWKIVEIAVACVSETSARRPTMNQVVIELNECLALEMARTREGNDIDNSLSQDSPEFMSLNVHTGMSPLVR